jgi:hypothetical protein
VDFVGVTEKCELVELCERSEGRDEADEETKTKNKEREDSTRGMWGSEDALRDQYAAKVEGMSNSDLKKLLQTLGVDPAGATERSELLDL